jgi:hypothetical protein
MLKIRAKQNFEQYSGIFQEFFGKLAGKLITERKNYNKYQKLLRKPTKRCDPKTVIKNLGEQ